MTITPDSLRRDLADGAAAAGRTQQSEGEIRRAAEQRREAIQTRIAELVPLVNRSPGAADEYQALIRERGQLDVVLAERSDD
jgi:hypothetical protein